MSKSYEKSNEALAVLAQRGCEVVKEKARDLLLRRNEGLIYDKALTYWNYVIGSDIDRSLTLDDLVQLGRIKFCEALAAFDPLRGTKLTTFMTAVLNNFMLDTIRPGLKEKEAIGGEFHWLDHYEVRKSRNRSCWRKSIGARFLIRWMAAHRGRKHFWLIASVIPQTMSGRRKKRGSISASAKQEPKIWSSSPARISKKTTSSSSAKPRNRCGMKRLFTNLPATRHAPIPIAE